MRLIYSEKQNLIVPPFIVSKRDSFEDVALVYGIEDSVIVTNMNGGIREYRKDTL